MLSISKSAILAPRVQVANLRGLGRSDKDNRESSLYTTVTVNEFQKKVSLQIVFSPKRLLFSIRVAFYRVVIYKMEL